MSERVGQQLGNYRLHHLIGRGSFADVYLGDHLHLNTQAAIKVLHTQFTSEDRERFYTEARTVARFVHPHIVRILDFDVEDSIPFLVMEYAPNGTLRQRHPKGTRVPLDIVISYVKQVAGALHYIHEQKLIHRDVKPKSMLLGRNHEVLLADFGIAIIAQSTRSQQTQEAAGSVTYMAPEQLRGKPRPASDQYALAIVTYEWLGGDPPFAGSVQQIASQHLSALPPPLHTKVPAISSHVEHIVLNALAKNPQQRFAHVQDFAMALEEAYNVESTGRTLFAPASEHPAESGYSKPAMRNLPAGTVTLLFTDIEGSTYLLQQLGDRYASVLAECRHLLRAAFQEWNGHEVDAQGDAFLVAFARATDAVLASVEMQRALASHSWPEGAVVRIRMGLHTGEPTLTPEGYVGLDVHRAARIMSAAHGGQVLLSQTTCNLVEQDLPDDVILRDLGEYRLKDLGRPRRLNQLVITGLPAEFPRLRTLDTYPNNLPVQLTPFIGREQELTAVQHMLRHDDVRLLTLTGPGGTGKTRLGLQVAAEVIDRFADGVFFVNLAPVNEPALVIPTIAQTLDIREITGQPLLERLRQELQQKQMLLLLDNFEQVVTSGVQIGDMLAACPRLKVLVTSREVLHVQAEHEFPVPPLALPDLKSLPDLAVLSHNAAVALFLQRAQAVKPDFQMTNANARAIVEICVRLDGLPLAIELAAARMKLLPPQALLARMDQRLAVLTGASRDVPARQQTLRNTIAWSYNLLDATEQRLFRRLSVFVGGCTLEAIESVCAALDNGEAGQALGGVASLVDKSLLQQMEQEEEEASFVMLETIREYGLERLTVNAEMEAMQEAHALYYLALAEQAEPHLKGAEQGQWFARLEQERDNLRAALTWLLEAAARGRGEEKGKQQAECALRLAVALYWFWYTAGPPSEGRSFLERVLSVGEGVATPLRARALFAAADLVWCIGDLDRAQALAEESLRLSQELRDTGGIANALIMLQAVAWLRNQYALARSYLEEAETLFREVGDTWSRGQCLTQLAQISTAQGEYVRALTLLEESRGLYSALGDQRRLSWVLYLLARVLFLSQGDLAEAQVLAEQSLALKREFKDTWNMHEVLHLLGQMRLHQGELALARELFEASLATGKETHWDLWITAKAQIGLARVLTLQGEGEMASALCQRSLALVREIGAREPILACLEGLADIVASQGELVWAVRLWGAAESLREAIGTPLPPIERDTYESSVSAARNHLGEKSFAAAWAEGRTMTPEQALTAQGPVTIPEEEPVIEQLPFVRKPPSPLTYPDDLTAREVEVLRLLAQGWTDAQIAEELVISPRTVNNHLTSIYSKIQVSSRSAATRYAMEHQLI